MRSYLSILLRRVSPKCGKRTSAHPVSSSSSSLPLRPLSASLFGSSQLCSRPQFERGSSNPPHRWKLKRKKERRRRRYGEGGREDSGGECAGAAVLKCVLLPDWTFEPISASCAARELSTDAWCWMRLRGLQRFPTFLPPLLLPLLLLRSALPPAHGWKSPSFIFRRHTLYLLQKRRSVCCKHIPQQEKKTTKKTKSLKWLHKMWRAVSGHVFIFIRLKHGLGFQGFCSFTKTCFYM